MVWASRVWFSDARAGAPRVAAGIVPRVNHTCTLRYARHHKPLAAIFN